MRKPYTAYNRHLETLLIQDGRFQANDFIPFHDALQADNTLSLDRLLIDKQLISRDEIGQLLSKDCGLNYTPLGQLTVDPSAFNALPLEFIELKHVIPVTQKNGKLHVAMVYTKDHKTLDEITFMAGIRPEPSVILAMEYDDFIRNAQQYMATAATAISPGTAPGNGTSPGEFSEKALNSWIDHVFQQAFLQQCSDIHIEPHQDQLEIRFRINGIIQRYTRVPEEFKSALIPRLKVMANLDMTEYRRPQEGRIKISLNNQPQYLRISSMPLSDHQEKLNLRVLKPFKGLMEYSTLGMSDQEIAQLQSLCQSPSGIVLTCGPTGAGKSTTLYTILNSINAETRNIITIEDPIELKLPHINQSQVNVKSDYTFANSIHSILRQDPDVIMIGEIRDQETLDVTIQSALTGHFILSSLHSTNAASAITRLVELGASPSLLSSSLRGIVAQRLIRTLCNHCKSPYQATEADYQVLFPYESHQTNPSITLYQATGCQLCHQTGYSGRIGLFEIMPIDRELRYVIGEFSSDMQLEDAAVSSGMKTLSMNGRMKALEGITSLDEVIRVLGLGQEA